MFVSGTASILHADLDAFFASVEQRDNPSLRGRPVVVGLGVAMAASYEAKRFGVRTAMSSYHVRRVCPQAIFVPPRMDAYAAASRAVFDVFRQISPLVEGVSIDEAFLEVGGLWRTRGTPEAIAADLRKRVFDEVGLRITVGVARTKFLAKVASGVAKPDGLLVVPVAGERDFLYPLPVEKLWGVGTVTAQKLHSHGLRTVAQIADIDEMTLASIVGNASGRHLYALAHFEDPRQVVTGKRRGSMGAQSAMGRGLKSPGDIDTTMVALVDRVTRRLRASERRGRTILLRLRFDDFTRITRSHTLSRSTDQTAPILAASRQLLAESMPLIREQGLTLVGISVHNFDDDETADQLELPYESSPGKALDKALDEVRLKFGDAAVTRAVLLGRRDGITLPVLPEHQD
ncbi:DNA polymerase IV [Nakamurella sp. s14-144]|uniref:DNA polymerase IV n=1 Tax=Nakamurella antarctica TaxID=1902245 RepID=UPI0019CF66AC